VLLDERVRARTALLQSILDTVPDAMIVIDAHGVVESFSATAERLFGYRSAEVCGRNVSMLMPSPIGRNTISTLNATAKRMNAA
jgi:two-component system, LuxR family, sensor kinase FixL